MLVYIIFFNSYLKKFISMQNENGWIDEDFHIKSQLSLFRRKMQYELTGNSVLIITLC